MQVNLAKPTSPSYAAISLDQSDWQCRLAIRRQALLEGPWQTRISRDGVTLAETAPWEQVCRYVDRTVHHREFQRVLAGGVRHQRQITLCPRDGLVLIADAVLGTRHSLWEYHLQLPLAAGWRVDTAAETFEITFSNGSSECMALPLAFPEWRASHPSGSLHCQEGQLTASWQFAGRAFFFPICLLVQTSPAAQNRHRPTSRANQSGHVSAAPGANITWRQLTVSESLRKVAADEAVGFRIQSGDQQWLLYRSLTPPANRAVLGHNLISESLLARFTKRGDVRVLVEIEWDDDQDDQPGDNGAA